VKRNVILYLATFIVMLPLDLLFLGVVAKSFFTSQVGDMLGEVRLAPAVLFYCLYIAGILIFVSASLDATWRSALLYGALFGTGPGRWWRWISLGAPSSRQRRPRWD
jgi:uncharacterized membrane protein